MCVMTGVDPAAENSDDANGAYHKSSVLDPDQVFSKIRSNLTSLGHNIFESFMTKVVGSILVLLLNMFFVNHN
jgi:hypothetical protein